MQPKLTGEGAINWLRAMEQRRAEITRKYTDTLAEAKKNQGAAKEAELSFWREPTPAGVREFVRCASQADAADAVFSELYRRIPTAIDAEFNREYAKDLRAVLVAAARHRRIQAQVVRVDHQADQAVFAFRGEAEGTGSFSTAEGVRIGVSVSGGRSVSGYKATSSLSILAITCGEARVETPRDRGK